MFSVRKRHHKWLNGKRLLGVGAAALLLAAAIPVFGAFAGADESAVSASDLSVSQTDTVYAAHPSASVEQEAAPKANKVYGEGADYISLVDFWWGYDYIENVDLSYDAATDSVCFIAPACSNSLNTFLYWKDAYNGKIYYPGNTYSIPTADLEQCCRNYDGSYHAWFINAIWADETLAVETEGCIQFDVPMEDDDDEAELLENDGLNRYKYGDCVNGTIKGVYHLSDSSIDLEEGYSKIQIPADMTPAYKDYTFVEWNTKKDGSGVSYQPGDYVPMRDSVEILFAIFDGYTKKNVVNVQFRDWVLYPYLEDMAEGYCFSLQYDGNGKIAQLTTPPALTNSKNTFKGWQNTESGKILAAGTTYYNVDMSENANPGDEISLPSMCFLAVWEGDELAVADREFNIWFEFENGSRNYQVPISGVYHISTRTCDVDGDPTFTIPNNLIPDNYEGFEFLGWNTSYYGNGTMYQPGEIIHLKDAEDGLGLFLYATYETDQEFEILVETSGSSATVSHAEPMVGLTFDTGASFDEIAMVLTDVENALVEGVQAALEEKIQINNASAVDISMVDIQLVDTRDNTYANVEHGRLKIIMPYPDIPNAKDYNYAIYHYENGEAQYIEVVKLEDGLMFYADSFSPYALIRWEGDAVTFKDNGGSGSSGSGGSNGGDSSNGGSGAGTGSHSDSNAGTTNNGGATTDSPGTGDDFTPAVFVTLAILSLASVGGVWMMRRRQRLTDSAEA